MSPRSPKNMLRTGLPGCRKRHGEGEERMTEEEWLNCTDPGGMLRHLGRKVSDRKLRLFACACCHRVDHLLTDPTIRKVLDAAERYADGLIADSTVDKWYRKGYRVRDAMDPRMGGPHAKWLACHAVASAAVSRRFAG